ncbi:hypothetical protein ABL78_5276 [Leptomonas seymouri]|uniref:RING-type domain-containing protein n=1 Tax=Leptomonas seymouri TaxID=5684 RepID=A0A0N1IJZ1_LEPSE|nr:hypothetical protein ABL78_5276 [Leptomonas seymouri]|eukprot:KPI85655.1 hypothetical protein ABL78_5276 [Leptomonas seymouri]
MPRHSFRSGSAAGRRLPVLLSVVLVALPFFYLCGIAQPALARLERQAYVSYRTPHLCSYQLMEAVKCGESKPMCCVSSSAIRCCPSTTSCGNCTDAIVGYEMPRSSVMLGCFSLSVFVLLGSIIMSGVGRHLAWVLERRRVIENYRKRLVLRRAEAREFKKELADTEERDIEDSVACVICCARHIDVALTPCGHVCCCRFCAKRLKECPVCRAGVQRCFDLPLYYVKQLVKATAEEREGGEEGSQASLTASAASSEFAAAAFSPTRLPERVEVGQEEGAARTREGLNAQMCCGCNAEVGTTPCYSRSRNEAHAQGGEEEDLDEEEAPSARFTPLGRQRYTLLCSEEDEDTAAMYEGPTLDVASFSVAPQSADDGRVTRSTAAYRGGYISVAKTL